MKNYLMQSLKNVHDSFLNMTKILNKALMITSHELPKLNLEKIYENEELTKSMNKFYNSMENMMFKQELLKQIKELKEINSDEQHLIHNFIENLEKHNPEYIDYVLYQAISWQNIHIADKLLNKKYLIKNFTCLDDCIKRANNPNFLQMLKNNNVDLFQRDKILVIKSITSFKYENVSFLFNQKNQCNKNYIELDDFSIIMGLKNIFVLKNLNTMLNDTSKINTLKVCFSKLSEKELNNILENDKLKPYDNLLDFDKIKSLFLHQKLQKKMKNQNNNNKIVKI